MVSLEELVLQTLCAPVIGNCNLGIVIKPNFRSVIKLIVHQDLER